jgi:GTP-binding protein SAR1
MWIVDWFKNKLQEIGWFGKKGKIVFLGLDDAGKTTLLKRLKEDKMAQLPPTLMPHAEELFIGNVSVTAWDLGGHEAARKTWRNYFAGINAIIFLVDASKEERFEEARIELENVLETESQNR